MKKTISMMCGALALLCLVSLFIPIIAPRYPVSDYHPGSDSYTKDYFLDGNYYIAREYWSLAKFALSCGHKVALSVASALLLYWATLSLMGEEARLAGVLAATANLAVAGYLLVKLLEIASGIRWFVLVVMTVDVVFAFVVAWYWFMSGSRKRYIKVPVNGK